MPNWCQNYLTVTGATPEFRAWLEANGFSFEKMNPPRIPRKKANNWLHLLDGCFNAWGTKWDLDDKEQRQVAGELLENRTAFFDTAWSPPMQAIEALSRKFPTVSFQLHYCELGIFFAGTATFRGGECDDDYSESKTGVMKIASEIFGFEDEEECDLVV